MNRYNRVFLVYFSFILANLSAAPIVWFSPLDSARHPGTVGSSQYMDLFTPGAQWKEAASHVKVFKIYPQWIEQADEAQLRQQFADLNRRHIDLALEYGVLTTSTQCSQGIQGEGKGGEHLMDVVRKIQRLGGNLKYVAMDEPIYFSEVLDSKTACHWSASQMAANAASNIRPVLEAYPSIKFGDIEPVGSAGGLPTQAMLTYYREGIEALQKTLGKPIAFFHADVNWTSASFPGNLVATRDMVNAEKVSFGVIYDGLGSNSSDSSWINSAMTNMGNAETSVGSPDEVIFQSWHNHPSKLLPETDPESFTWLIDQYFRPRTRITSQVSGKSVSGTLLDSTGQPLKGREVSLSFNPTSSGKLFKKDYSVQDVIPPGTQSIEFGIRVNTECGCSGIASFELVKFNFQVDNNASSTSAAFVNDDDLNKWPSMKKAIGSVGNVVSIPTGAKVGITNGILKVVAQPGQKVQYTSSPFPVNSSGKFQFDVSANMSPETVDSGSFILIFLKSTGEITRKILPIKKLEVVAITAKTDSTGHFRADLPTEAAQTSSGVVATYAGGQKSWPAASKRPSTDKDKQ